MRGSHTGGYGELYLRVKVNRRFGEHIASFFMVEKQAKQESSMKQAAITGDGCVFLKRRSTFDTLYVFLFQKKELSRVYNFLHGVLPVVCHIIAFYGADYKTIILTNKSILTHQYSVYLVKASLQKSDLTHHISVNSPDENLVRVETCSQINECWYVSIDLFVDIIVLQTVP
jgi:hypothetical protein